MVANRNSGMGRGLRLVRRLVRALRRVGLSERSRLDSGGTSVAREPICGRPALPLPGGRRR